MREVAPCARWHGPLIFKDKTEEEGAGVTDLIYRAVQVLRENLYWIRISAQNTGLMEPVELWDKG